MNNLLKALTSLKGKKEPQGIRAVDGLYLADVGVFCVRSLEDGRQLLQHNGRDLLRGKPIYIDGSVREFKQYLTWDNGGTEPIDRFIEAMPREDFVEALLLKGKSEAAKNSEYSEDPRKKQVEAYLCSHDPKAPICGEPQYIPNCEDAYRIFSSDDYTGVALLLHTAKETGAGVLDTFLKDLDFDALLSEMRYDTNGCVGRLREQLDAHRNTACAHVTQPTTYGCRKAMSDVSRRFALNAEEHSVI